MNYKILVIDDEKVVCKAIQLELESSGYEVEWTLNGKEAVKRVKGNGFDLAIIDLVLPDIDGVEVCKEIKEQEPKMKAVLMSGYLDRIEARKEEFISAGGCKHIIRKPFNEGDFVLLIKDVFGEGTGC